MPDYTPDKVDKIRFVIHEDTPIGYEMFYGFIWNRPLPKHGRQWIDRLYEELGKDPTKPGFVEAFRGSTKTTIFTITWSAYRVGLYPDRSGLFIQSADEKAEESAAKVAEIIESNSAWKLCFPNVVPDKDRGWSSKGYNVKDTSVPYDEWVRRLAKDPTFVGLGYTSTQIPGYHPTNFLIVDDIHNEENSTSPRELKRVKTVYSGSIMYTRMPVPPPTLVVGTPWRDDDLYADIKATGAYWQIRTPVKDKDGVLAWPEVMTEEVIKKAEAEDVTGGIETARMLFLDLNAMQKRVFQYQLFPSDKIDHTWPMYGGCDYAAVADPSKVGLDHSHFALAHAAKSPYGTAVCMGGELEQISMGEGMTFVKKAQTIFPNWQHTEIEGDGKGEEFYSFCMLQDGLMVFMNKTKGVPKARRLVNILGPLLKTGRVVISDASTPFLNSLRNFLNKYPNVPEHDPGWDAADSLFWAVHSMPMIVPKNLDLQNFTGNGQSNSKKSPNPWSGLAKVRNYA